MRCLRPRLHEPLHKLRRRELRRRRQHLHCGALRNRKAEGLRAGRRLGRRLKRLDWLERRLERRVERRLGRRRGVE